MTNSRELVLCVELLRVAISIIFYVDYDIIKTTNLEDECLAEQKELALSKRMYKLVRKNIH